MKRAILAGVVSTVALTSPGADADMLRPGAPPPGVYVRFVKYGGGSAGVGACAVNSSTIVVSEQNAGSRWPSWHPVQQVGFNIEQTLNIGSQSSGAGAGRITFNPFSFSMPMSSLDATLMDLASSGTPFCQADLLLVSAQGPTELFSFRLAAVKTIAYAPDSAGHSTTTVTLEFGGLLIVNQSFRPDGTAGKATGKFWNRVQNITQTPSASDLALSALMP